MPKPPLYDGLDSNEIRLIELLPGGPDAQIQCRLLKTTLDNAPAYEAVSYVWGDPSVTETIHCNDHSARITISLAQALRRLRGSPGTPARTLWADAICINQTDVMERNQQVPLMTKIYPGAVRVIAWLGLEDSKAVSTAIAAINYIHSKQVRVADDRARVLVADEHVGAPKYADLVQHLQERGLDSFGVSLTNFFSLSYWARVWCAQEAHISRTLLVLVGEEEISGFAIGAFLLWFIDECMKEVREGRLPEDSDAMNVSLMYTPALLLQPTPVSQGEPDLFWTLYNFKDTHATDARDKVYGLLGINTQIAGSAPTIKVDYNSSVAEVYIDIVLEALSRRNDLDVLSCVEHDKNFDPDSGIPSWVPRWDLERSIGARQMLHQGTHISAGRPVTTWSGGFSAVSKTLRLHGIAFDGVLGTSPILPGLTWLERNAEFKEIFSRLWTEIHAKESEYKHRHTIEELATTLTGGFCGLVRNLNETAAIGDYYSVLENTDSAVGKQYISDFRGFVKMMNLPRVGEGVIEGDGESFAHLAGLVCSDRRIFRTWRGYLGLGPACMQEDDLIVVLDGGKMAYVLRQLPESGHAFIGECFVYAIKNGEAYDMVGKDEVQRAEFILC